MTELYAILVLKYNIAPDYVLDSMQMYEARALMKYDYYSSKDSWEQSRLVAYVMAQVNSTKRLKPTDILQFEWDKQNNEANKISDEDIARLQNKAKDYLKYMNSNDNGRL